MTNNLVLNTIFDDEYVWHYTRLDAFLSIIKNKELWLSNLKYTNDPLEGEFSYYEFARILKRLAKKPEYQYIYKCFLKLNKDLFIIDSNIYSMSFSKKNDKMQHWQVYGDNFKGIAFRVNVAKIKKLVHDLDFANQYLYYLEMKYNHTDLEVFVEKHISLLLEQYKNFDNEKMLPNIILSAYNMALLQNKSDIFLGEDETRFALCESFMENSLANAIKTNESIQTLENYGIGPKSKEFYFSKGLIKSRYSIKLDKMWCDGLIDEVVIGPLCNQDPRELKDFLASTGLKTVKVLESSLKGKVRF